MAQHTRGPWTIPQPWSGFTAIRGANGELVFGLAAGSAEEKRPDDECDANARLIASAPDLLAALKAMVAEHDVLFFTKATRDEARAAIAKAEGTESNQGKDA